MARPKNTEARRAQIVDALLEVMASEGYARATVSAIGKAAGLTPGLLHYHFESKHEILVALIERLAGTLEARILARRDEAGDAPMAQLEAFLEACVGLGADADLRAVSAWVVVGAEAVREPQVRALYTQTAGSMLAQLRRLVRAALRARGATTRSAPRTAMALLSAIEGAYRISAAAPGLLPEGFAAPMLRQLARGLVSAEAERT